MTMNSTNDSHGKPGDIPTKLREGLVNIDDTIDEIGRKALASARRSEEEEKRKKKTDSPGTAQERAVPGNEPRTKA